MWRPRVQRPALHVFCAGGQLRDSPNFRVASLKYSCIDRREGRLVVNLAHSCEMRGHSHAREVSNKLTWYLA